MGFEAVQPTENRGRPPLLEARPSVGDELAIYLDTGLFITEACALVGVSRQSVYKLLRQGNKDIENEIDSPEAKFTDKLKRAMANFEQKALARMEAAGGVPAFWAANAWLLERKFPQRYGRRDRVALEHSGQMGLGVANVDKPLSERLNDADKRKAAKDIARSLAIIGSGGIGPVRGTDGVGDPGDELEGDFTESSELPEWKVD